MNNQEMTRHDHVLAGLMFSLQAAAMQQMGKIQDPNTGAIDVSLEQAKATIDVLEMLKAKCRTDTPDELLRALDGAVLELQMNYMDEVKKGQPVADTATAKEPAAATQDTPDAAGAED